MKARAAAVVLALAAIAGVAFAGLRLAQPPAPAAQARPPALQAPRRYLGVVGNLPVFDAETRLRANLSALYLNWGSPFPAAVLTANATLGAETLLEIEPRDITLAAVAAGKGDAWLARLASGLTAARLPVMVSFAPEMNGDWYPWGARRVTPAVFVAAWRHVHRALARVPRVTWLWQVAPLSVSQVPLLSLWPGRRYVSATGIDAYFYVRSDTVGGVFGATITTLRALAGGLPVLISETAAGPASGPAAKIRALFAGVASYHLAGLVWFDVAQHHGLYHQDWSLEDDPAALAVFRQAARGYAR